MYNMIFHTDYLFQIWQPVSICSRNVDKKTNKKNTKSLTQPIHTEA